MTDTASPPEVQELDRIVHGQLVEEVSQTFIIDFLDQFLRKTQVEMNRAMQWGALFSELGTF